MADGVGEVNWEGVKYYNTLIDGLLERGKFNFAYLLHHIIFDLSLSHTHTHTHRTLQDNLIL
jgi:beta-glucosidase/6-phospho-beta-glucosidase/beta-galactosidase